MSHAKSGFGRLAAFGCRLSEAVADVAAQPYAQLALILFCLAWFATGFSAGGLTAALSVFAITLTQMVLNKQEAREADAHRRDVALHAKLDELILATREARNEIAGIEEMEEEEIVALKDAANVTPMRRRRGKTATSR
ncbi:MAG: low affinity iron permease family protein [Alphaproteobacteria bacterium]|nr:low affinity iron permease family protein [Alphaproteobacteria bacterium]MBV9371927.1 low affinity iron permease family protein [Alphaproteobacteria bacterium]MBV9900428.1 low affinity iron permease family protein [Alphaproteobacteria bacterium]